MIMATEQNVIPPEEMSLDGTVGKALTDDCIIKFTAQAHAPQATARADEEPADDEPQAEASSYYHDALNVRFANGEEFALPLHSYKLDERDGAIVYIKKSKGKEQSDTAVLTAPRPIWCDCKIITDALDKDGRRITVDRYRFRWNLQSRISDAYNASQPITPDDKFVICDVSEAISTRYAQAVFSNAGYTVSEAIKKQFVNYIAAMVSGLNRDRGELYRAFPVYREVTQLGWYTHNGKKVFVPYADDAGVILLNDGNKTKDALRAQAGDAEIWCREIKPYLSNRAVAIALAATFAAPLVSILNALPFIVDVVGKTGTGKSVLLKICASIYGEPETYFTSFNGTKNNLITKAATLNHFPLLIDEMECDGANRKAFQEFVIAVTEGKERGGNTKAGTERKQKTFRSITIINGEHAGLTASDKAGAHNRVITVNVGDADLFGNTQNAAYLASQFVAEQYGTIGRKWIEDLTKVINYKDHFEKHRNRYKELTDDLIERYHTTGKQAAAAALLILTSEIVFKLYFDAAPLTVADFEEIVLPADEIDNTTRFLRWFDDFIGVNHNSFITSEMKRDGATETYYPNHGEIWGKIEDDYCYIYPTILEREARNAGFTLDGTMIDDLVRLKRLKQSEETKGGRPSQRNTIFKWIDGKSRRVYALIISSLNRFPPRPATWGTQQPSELDDDDRTIESEEIF